MIRYRKKRISGAGIIKFNTDSMDTSDEKSPENNTEKTNIEQLKEQLKKLDIKDTKVKKNKKFIKF